MNPPQVRGPIPAGPRLATAARAESLAHVEARAEPSDTTAPARAAAASGTAWKAAIGLLAAVLGYAAFFGSGAPSGEVDTPNWSAHVEPAQRAYRDDAAKPLRWLDHGGVAHAGDTIAYGAADLDDATAHAVREAVAAGDPDRAVAALFAAQEFAGRDRATPRPVASPALKSALARPDLRFVRVYLFDACFEDGDVVELFLDDDLIAAVPLANAGATLTLPVPAGGRARIVLRGHTDGGGGITVGCRTSQGDFFCRPMTVGEVQPVGIVGP